MGEKKLVSQNRCSNLMWQKKNINVNFLQFFHPQHRSKGENPFTFVKPLHLSLRKRGKKEMVKMESERKKRKNTKVVLNLVMEEVNISNCYF